MTTPLYARALACLEAVLEAAPQSGPQARDRDVDHAALCAALHDAEVLLYEAGRLVP